MQSVAYFVPVSSFEASKRGRSYLIKVSNLRPEPDSVYFQLDTGAGMSLIGLNTICGDDEKKKEILHRIILEESSRFGIKEEVMVAQTVTREEVNLYPCRCEGVSVSNTAPKPLYFHIYLGDVSMPLLGFDYIDDCTCHHTINGNFIITAIADTVGKRFYPEKVLDFNKILEEYEKELKEITP